MSTSLSGSDVYKLFRLPDCVRDYNRLRRKTCPISAGMSHLQTGKLFTAAGIELMMKRLCPARKSAIPKQSMTLQKKTGSPVNSGKNVNIEHGAMIGTGHFAAVTDS